jgi:hypothetical protein
MSVSGAMIRGQNVTNLVPRSPRNLIDRELVDNINNLSRMRKAFDSNDKMLRKAFDLESGRAKRIFAKVLESVIPKFLYVRLPEGIATFIAEEFEIVDFTEHVLKTHINDAQVLVKNISSCGQAKNEEIDALRADIQDAKAEGWDAQQIHNYISDKIDIVMDDEVSSLLGGKFHVLSQEEKDRHRDMLLRRLERNIVNGEKLCVYLGQVCYVSLEFLDELRLQYFDFVNVARPLKVIKSAAKELLEGNKSVLGANAVFQTNFEITGAAFETITQTGRLLAKNQVASEENLSMIQKGIDRLKTGLAEMQKMREITGTRITVSKVPELPGKVIDVESAASSTAPAQLSN